MVVSAMSDCKLCVRFHANILRQQGMDDADLAEVMEVMTEVAKGNLIMNTLGLGDYGVGGTR